MAPHKASIWFTATAQSFMEVSPLESRAMQWLRHTCPAATQCSAAVRTASYARGGCGGHGVAAVRGVVVMVVGLGGGGNGGQGGGCGGAADKLAAVHVMERPLCKVGVCLLGINFRLL